MIIALTIAKCLPILYIIAAAVTRAENPGTVVHNKNVNKNVNIIVNLDARDVAKELWRLMKNRLNNGTISNNLFSEQNIIEDLETAVQPLVSPTRRGTSPLYAYQVASDLDQIIRTAYIRNFPDMNMLDLEITIRNTVANMMATLKILMSKTFVESSSSSSLRDEMRLSGRRMQTLINDEEDNYIDVRIKIHKKDLFNALQ